MKAYSFDSEGRKRRRHICTVLREIRAIAEAREDHEAVTLCDEALDMARRMSLKLHEYKRATE